LQNQFELFAEQSGDLDINMGQKKAYYYNVTCPMKCTQKFCFDALIVSECNASEMKITKTQQSNKRQQKESTTAIRLLGVIYSKVKSPYRLCDCTIEEPHFSLQYHPQLAKLELNVRMKFDCIQLSSSSAQPLFANIFGTCNIRIFCVRHLLIKEVT
jgi:hypothetical protein